MKGDASRVVAPSGLTCDNPANTITGTPSTAYYQTCSPEPQHNPNNESPP